MKYLTVAISLAKQKQSDHKQILSSQFHIGLLSSQVALVETLKAIIHTQGLIYVDRAYALVLLLINLKQKNLARKKFPGRKLSRFRELSARKKDFARRKFRESASV